MNIELQEKTCARLNQRWHDQAVDLRTIRHDVRHKSLSFLVSEEDSKRRKVCALGPFGVFANPVRWQQICLFGVKEVQMMGLQQEAELLIADIKCSPSNLILKGINGEMDIRGENLRMTVDEAVGTAIERRYLSLLIGEISWIKKLKHFVF